MLLHNLELIFPIDVFGWNQIGGYKPCHNKVHG